MAPGDSPVLVAFALFVWRRLIRLLVFHLLITQEAVMVHGTMLMDRGAWPRTDRQLQDFARLICSFFNMFG